VTKRIIEYIIIIAQTNHRNGSELDRETISISESK